MMENSSADASLSSIALAIFIRQARPLSPGPQANPGAAIDHTVGWCGRPPAASAAGATAWQSAVRSWPGARASGLARRLLSDDRRQGLDVGRNGAAVVGAELLGIAHDLGHGGADRVPIGGLAALEQIGDILVRPILQAVLGDVGHPALAVGRRAAGEALGLDDAPRRIAR